MKQKALALCGIGTSPPVILGTTKPKYFQSPLEGCHSFLQIGVKDSSFCHSGEK